MLILCDIKIGLLNDCLVPFILKVAELVHSCFQRSLLCVEVSTGLCFSSQNLGAVLPAQLLLSASELKNECFI